MYNQIMKILSEVISPADLAKSNVVFDGPMVKAVVDVESGLLAIDAELHADLEKFLLENGSNQNSLWGINLWYEDKGDDFVEFESMINVRPRLGNHSRGVDDPATCTKILEVVNKWIH